jgi:hypothetical protein
MQDVVHYCPLCRRNQESLELQWFAMDGTQSPFSRQMSLILGNSETAFPVYMNWFTGALSALLLPYAVETLCRNRREGECALLPSGLWSARFRICLSTFR